MSLVGLCWIAGLRRAAVTMFLLRLVVDRGELMFIHYRRLPAKDLLNV